MGVYGFQIFNQRLRIAHQLIDEVEVEVYFDQNWFLSADYQATYYEDLAKNKLFHEKGISLERVPKTLPNFYQRLDTTWWMCFTPKSCFSNE